jgi:hypothetical protein
VSDSAYELPYDFHKRLSGFDYPLGTNYNRLSTHLRKNVSKIKLQTTLCKKWYTEYDFSFGAKIIAWIPLYFTSQVLSIADNFVLHQQMVTVSVSSLTKPPSFPLRVDYTVRFRCAFLCPTNRLTQRLATLVGKPLRQTVCRT